MDQSNVTGNGAVAPSPASGTTGARSRPSPKKGATRTGKTSKSDLVSPLDQLNILENVLIMIQTHFGQVQMGSGRNGKPVSILLPPNIGRCQQCWHFRLRDELNEVGLCPDCLQGNAAPSP